MFDSSGDIFSWIGDILFILAAIAALSIIFEWMKS